MLSRAPHSARRSLILAGTIIDGSGRPPLERGAVLIEGDRILACDRAADLGRPEGVRVIEAPHQTLIPGLIDAHVHLA